MPRFDAADGQRSLMSAFAESVYGQGQRAERGGFDRHNPEGHHEASARNECSSALAAVLSNEAQAARREAPANGPPAWSSAPVSDGSPFVVHDDLLPWPCPEAFNIGPKAAVGVSGPFAWLVSGSRALLWDCIGNRYVLVHETEFDVTSVTVARVGVDTEVYWIFLVTSNELVWCSLDAQCGVVVRLAAASLAQYAVVERCFPLGDGSGIMLVHDDATVSLAVPQLVGSCIAIVRHQSWGAWTRSWIKRVALQACGASTDGGDVFVLDSNGVLCCWSSRHPSGSPQPSIRWQFQVTTPAPSGIVFVGCSQHVITLVSSDATLVRIAEPTSRDDKTPEVLSTTRMPGVSSPVIVCAATLDDTVAMADGAGGCTTLATVTSSMYLGLPGSRVVCCNIPTDCDGRAVYIAPKGDRPQDAIVITIGLRGAVVFDVLQRDAHVARLAHDRRLAAHVPRMLAACGSPQDVCLSLLRGAECIVDASTRTSRPYLSPTALTEIANALNDFSVPSVEDASVVMSPAAIAAMQWTRAVCTLHGAGGVSWPRADVLVYLCSDAAASGALAARLEIVRRVLDAVFGRLGWTISANCAPPDEGVWAVRESSDGGEAVVVTNLFSSSRALRQRDGIGHQATALLALTQAVSRLQLLSRLVCVAAEARVPLPRMPVTIDHLTDTARDGEEGAALSDALFRVAVALAAAGGTTAGQIVGLLADLPQRTATAVAAWNAHWNSTRDEASNILTRDAAKLHGLHCLDDLAAAVCRTHVEKIVVFAALVTAATLEDPPNKSASRSGMKRVLAVLASETTPAGLQACVESCWRCLPRSTHHKVGGWLIDRDLAVSHSDFADLFAAAPASATEPFLNVPSLPAAKYLLLHDRPEAAALLLLEVAQQPTGVPMLRRKTCMDLAVASGASKSQDSDAVEALRDLVDLQHDLYHVVLRAQARPVALSTAALAGGSASPLHNDDDDGIAEVGVRSTMAHHVSLLDDALLDAASIYGMAQTYRGELGAAFIEIKLLAREPAAEERCWIEAINAAIDCASGVDDRHRALLVVAEAVVRECIERRCSHLPLYYLVSCMEVACQAVPNRNECLLRGGATIDDVFEAYLIILEDRRVPLAPGFNFTPPQLLHTMAKFVQTICETDAATHDQRRRYFTAVESRLKRLSAAARVGQLTLQSNDANCLLEAQRALDDCEGGMTSGMGTASLSSQGSFIF